MRIMNDPGHTAHLSQETRGDILDAAEETYVALARRYGHSLAIVHRVGLCVPASDLMDENLSKRGHEVTRVRSPMWIEHHYVALPAEGFEEDVLIDPTWQQFLDGQQIKPEMPKVLMVPIVK